MPDEPGFNLSRLIAAERNALAAIEAAKLARNEASDLRQRVGQLEAEIVALKAVCDQQHVTIAMLRGGGPTARQ